MSKKPKEKKQIFLDFPSVIEKMKGKEVDLNYTSISKGMDVSTVIVRKWRVEAPKLISRLHYFLKEHDLKFEDLVKEK